MNARTLALTVNLTALALAASPHSRAELVAAQLVDTAQINPDNLPVLAAVNMRFSNQAAGLGGEVNGVEFEDVIWSATTTTLSSGVTFGTSPNFNQSRSANTSSTISGPDEAIIENVANTINFYNVDTDGVFTFGNLPPSVLVQVQLITSDAASSFNNWAGVNHITVTDTTTATVTEIGSHQAGTEPDNLDAQLATFEATVDADGNLEFTLDQTTAGQHFGVGGIIIYASTRRILEIDLDRTDFLSSLGEGGVAGVFSTVDQQTEATHSYTLVPGEGDGDNEKFVIAGNELQLGTHDFSAAGDGDMFSVRIRTTDDADAARHLEAPFVLTIHLDTDADTLWDSWENRHTDPDNLDTLNGDGVADADGDSLSDRQEFELSLGAFPDLDPTSADTDGDGLPDNEELAGAGARPPTDPTSADSDGDGLDDQAESATGIFVDDSDTGSDPTIGDTDGDGIDDGAEVNGTNPHGFRSNPNQTDSDGDGIGDATELAAGTDPRNPRDFPQFAAGQLTETSQINPAALPVLAAVNMVFANQPPGLGGTVNGVAFEDVLWGDTPTLTSGVTVTTSDFFDTRNANTAGSISGPGEEVLENIANSINFYPEATDGTVTFGGLPPGQPVIVQMITGDAASSFNNWAGIFAIAIVDTVTQAATVLPEFQAGTEPNNLDAQLATFAAVVDESGTLELLIDQVEVGQHAGIGGIVILQGGPAARIPLRVDRTADELTFTWDSQNGRLYNLLSSLDLAADSSTWPVWDGNGDLVATPPENVLTIPLPDDTTRFFVIEEFPAPPEVIFSDDFENGAGDWTTGSDGADGTAWELGQPSNVGPDAANSPPNCFATNLDSDYELDADVWLRSPEIDLTTAAGATLRYAQFFDIEEGFDYGIVTILNASDNSELAVIEDALGGVSLGWEEAVKTLPPAVLGQKIKVEFRLQSDDISSFAGWYLDDIVVTVP